MLDCKCNRKSQSKNHSRLHRLGKTSASASRKYRYDLEKERICIVILSISAFESMLISVLGFSLKKKVVSLSTINLHI